MKKFKLLTVFCFWALIFITSWVTMRFAERCTLPYNSEGNYFDSRVGIVYHEQSLLVFGIIDSVFILLTILAGFFAIKKAPTWQ